MSENVNSKPIQRTESHTSNEQKYEQKYSVSRKQDQENKENKKEQDNKENSNNNKDQEINKKSVDRDSKPLGNVDTNEQRRKEGKVVDSMIKKL